MADRARSSVPMRTSPEDGYSTTWMTGLSRSPSESGSKITPRLTNSFWKSSTCRLRKRKPSMPYIGISDRLGVDLTISLQPQIANCQSLSRLTTRPTRILRISKRRIRSNEECGGRSRLATYQKMFYKPSFSTSRYCYNRYNSKKWQINIYVTYFTFLYTEFG